MIEEILNFYRTTKLKKEVSEAIRTNEVPVTFEHVFHKEYPRLNSIKLPKTEKEGEFSQLLFQRKSSRKFSKKPINFKSLAQILTSIRILERRKNFERRTYPSGGARFPIEVYPISFNVCGLDPGVFHYSFKKHLLEVLWRKDLSSQSDYFVSPAIQNPSAVIFLTSVLSRSEIKYSNKSLGYSMIEAGHMTQNMSLMAEKLRLGYCPVGGFIDEEVIKTLDLVRDEIPIYALALGKVEEHDSV